MVGPGSFGFWYIDETGVPGLITSPDRPTMNEIREYLGLSGWEISYQNLANIDTTSIKFKLLPIDQPTP